MNAPLLILTFGISLSTASFAWRGRTVAAPLVAALGAALLGALALGAVLGEPFEVLGVGFKLEPGWSVLGRSLVLDAENRPWVGFIFLSGAMLLAAAAMAGTLRRTAAIGLLMLLALTAALMVRPFVFSPVFLAAGAILGCLLVVRPSGGSGRAPARLLIAYVLAMMAILVAGWLIETRGVTSSPETPARSAVVLLALGSAILVMTPPAHTWLTAAADEAHPMAMVLVATSLQASGLMFLVSLLRAYAWVRGEPLMFEFLRGAGLVMILVGGLSASGERRMPRVAAYAMLIDFGVSLLALGAGNLAGVTVAVGMAATRTLSAAVWGLGFVGLRPSAQGEAAPDPGVNRWARMASLAGLLSLAGVPLTAGFPGRWLVLTEMIGPVEALVVLLAAWATAGAALRGWNSTHGETRAESTGWPTVPKAALATGVALLVILGLLPDPIFRMSQSALESLSRLLP